MSNLGIDFDAARGMSGDISGLTSQSTKIKAKFNAAKSKIGDMPHDFVSTTVGTMEVIDTLFEKIEKDIKNTASTFDICVDNYYKVEKGGSSSSGASLTEIKAENKFYWSYPEASGSMHTISSEKLGELFSKYGATQNGNTYTFNIDGKEYKYNIGSHRLNCGNGDAINVVFLAGDNVNFNDIENTITFLGGSGERAGFGNDLLSDLKNEGLSKNSMVIIPYNSSHADGNMSKAPDSVISSTLTGEYLAGGGKKNTYNSIIGYSEGAQSAFRAVADSDGKLYDSIVAVNGSAYWTKDGINLIERDNGTSGYDPFKDMEIIFIESKNNNNWNPTIKETVNNLVNHGVSKGNISFFTNDSELSGYLDSKGMKWHTIGDSYSKHGDAWNMIMDSNIINYLSNKK